MNPLSQALGWLRGSAAHNAQTDEIASWLLSLFLALGPVYWLPGISTERLLRPFEWSILLLALVLVFQMALLRSRLSFPTGLLGPLGFAGLLLFWIPGLAQARAGFLTLEFVIQLGLTAAFFWCFFCIARGGGDVFAILRRAFVILTLLAGAALAAALSSTMDWRSPCEWNSAYANGLGLLGSAWSAGLALFVPLAALFWLPKESRRPLTNSLSSLPSQGEATTRTKWVPALAGPAARQWTGMTAAVLGFIVLVASQLVSGGRAGLLATVLLIGVFTLLRSTRWLAVSIMLVGLLAGLVYLDESCAHHLKLHLVPRILDAIELDPAEYNPNLPRLLEGPTDHQAPGSVLYLSKVKAQPLPGPGLAQGIVASAWGNQSELDNPWLKWSVAMGVAAPLLAAVIIALILLTRQRTRRSQRGPAPAVRSAPPPGLDLLTGLTMAEREVVARGASPVASGGRARLLASGLLIRVSTLLRSTRWLAISVVLVGLLAGLVYLGESFIRPLNLHLMPPVAGAPVPAEPNRYSPFLPSPIEDLTAHRSSGYALGISKVKEQPLLGHGLAQVIVESTWGDRSEIHNLWLKWAAYTGVAAPLMLAVIIALILRTCWRILRDPLRPETERSGTIALGLVILTGLVISLLEVNIPIGAFQHSAVFWAAAGALVGIANRSPQPAAVPPPPRLWSEDSPAGPMSQPHRLPGIRLQSGFSPV